jgi:hypothetical protein
MFLEFILLLLLVLMLSPDLLYINFLFYAVISGSHGSCFQNKKRCLSYILFYIYQVIHTLTLHYND